jgi:hypothetical protein
VSDRPIDYDRMVAEFEKGLVTTLRGHAPMEEYLETWVPDADPVSGLLNMLEAAEVGGRASLDISVRLDTLPEERHGEFTREAADIAKVALEIVGDRVLIRATEIGGGA